MIAIELHYGLYAPGHDITFRRRVSLPGVPAVGHYVDGHPVESVDWSTAEPVVTVTIHPVKCFDPDTLLRMAAVIAGRGWAVHLHDPYKTAADAVADRAAEPGDGRAVIEYGGRVYLADDGERAVLDRTGAAYVVLVPPMLGDDQ